MPCYRGEQRRKSDGRLDGKTALITGANTGLGKETAIELGARGARVLLACRSKSRADTAAEEIRERSGNPDVVVYILDLASLQSVRDCAAENIKNEPRLDILINNADAHLASLGQQTFSEATRDDSSGSGHSLRLMLRVSVTEGVREMYDHYCSRKRQEVTQPATERRAGARRDHMTLELPATRGRRSDKTVRILTGAECQFYRGS